MKQLGLIKETLQEKRINQLEFILRERVKPSYLSEVPKLAKSEVVNVLETKRGGVYMIPSNYSKSGRFEVVKLKN